MKPVDAVCLVLIFFALLFAVSCAQVGYVASGVGAASTEYKFHRLQERVRALEDQDIWTAP